MYNLESTKKILNFRTTCSNMPIIKMKLEFHFCILTHPNPLHSLVYRELEFSFMASVFYHSTASIVALSASAGKNSDFSQWVIPFFVLLPLHYLSTATVSHCIHHPPFIHNNYL